jgi:hypothetical protein
VKVAYQAAKQENPNAVIHLAGLTYYHDDKYLQRFIDEASALQGVTDGLARDDFGAVAAAARKVGAGSEAGRMPPAIAKKLPLEFRQLARATHEQFDVLAADATGRRDVRHTLAQTSALMQRCNACHAVFQFPH